MSKTVSRPWAAFCLAGLLGVCSARAGDVLTVRSPVELQVIQRDQRDRALVTVSGLIEGTADVIEARADLSPGASRGRAVGWAAIAQDDEIEEGKFAGAISLDAGGWYAFSVRARRGGDVVAEARIARVGVGDVFITAGQSNSANYGRPRQVAKDDRVVYYNGKGFVPARDHIPGGCGGGGSVWPLLGDLIAKAHDIPVCFRSASQTWTEVKNWLPEVKCRRFYLYKNLVECVNQFGRDGVRAVLWHQGESDSLAKTPAETYCDRLKTIIESLNRDSGYHIPWFVAQASFHPGSKAPQEEEVARGQRLLWERGIARQGPVTDDLLGKRYRCDGVHFNQLGLATHAERWFAALPPVYERKAGPVAKKSLEELRKEFRDLKLGMFIHFNLATYLNAEWVKGYHDPATFNPGGRIDTDAWADAAVSAGMKYIVLTTKHVSGFCLWDSKYTTYDVMHPDCPYQEDLVAQFVESCRSRGLKPGFYYCWRHPGFGDPEKHKVLPPECDPAKHSKEEQIEFQKKQIAELIGKFPDVFYIWNDALDDKVAPAEEINAYLKSLNPNILTSSNWWSWGRKGTPYMDIAITELRHFKDGNTATGETCIKLGRKWFWKKGSGGGNARGVMAHMKRAHARNANLLVNVDPDPQGRIVPSQVKALAEFGKMLEQESAEE